MLCLAKSAGNYITFEEKIYTLARRNINVENISLKHNDQELRCNSNKTLDTTQVTSSLTVL